MAHAKLMPPSASHTWIPCAAGPVLAASVPNESTKFSAEGSAAHTLAQWSLEQKKSAMAFLDHVITEDGYSFIVDQEMAKPVQTYVDYVNRFADEAELILVEQKLPLVEITGEDSKGTADAIVLVGTVLHVIDLKFGKGVRVVAKDNPQLLIYALAAYLQISVFAEIRKVVVHIVQPRLDHVDDWEISVADLLAFGETVKAAAARVREAAVEIRDDHFAPGEKQCRFCRVRGSCKALAAHVMSTVADDFVDLSKPIDNINADRTMDAHQLAHVLAALPLITAWVKAVEEQGFARAMSGEDIPGFKLVEGRGGNRKWGNEMAAEAVLQTTLGEQAWERKLISPANAEKALRKIDPGAWEKASVFIAKSVGQPTLVPVSDKRPSISPGISDDDFENLT